jgi:HTH-type transcriptional regulator, competence development regulator
VGEPGTTSDPRELGSKLRQTRELRHKSLSTVAAAAAISTAYLQKLEVGDVRQPSPHVLHALSEVLDIDYAELMRLAGYVVPSTRSTRQRRRNELTHALSSEALTEDEAEALAEYLNWYRSRQRRTK